MNGGTALKILNFWLAAMLASASAFANCTGWATGVSGQIIYIAPDMKYCDGTNWRIIGLPVCSTNGTPPTWSTSSNSWVCTNNLSSCKAILNAGLSHGNGTYTINTGVGGDISVFCDMTVDGGGWTLVVSHGPYTTPSSSASVYPNSGTYLSDSIYAALNTNVTEYLFYTSKSGTYYYKMPKTWTILANCQNMLSASPVLAGPWYGYGMKDAGCDAGWDSSGVVYGDNASYFEMDSLNGAAGSYSTNGSTWIPLPSSYVDHTIGGTDFLLGFAR